MEKLKNIVPDALKQQIGESDPNNLLSAASSLLDFFHSLPLFHQIVGDLTDPEKALCSKNNEAALEAKLKGNECFSKGEYSNAALRSAPLYVDDMAKDPVTTLYVNRASAFYKMGLLVECLRDTTWALLISPEYAKVVILLSQIRVNSMAIVRMKSFDVIGYQFPEVSLCVDASTTTVEQSGSSHLFSW